MRATHQPHFLNSGGTCAFASNGCGCSGSCGCGRGEGCGCDGDSSGCASSRPPRDLLSFAVERYRGEVLDSPRGASVRVVGETDAPNPEPFDDEQRHSLPFDPFELYLRCPPWCLAKKQECEDCCFRTRRNVKKQREECLGFGGPCDQYQQMCTPGWIGTMCPSPDCPTDPPQDEGGGGAGAHGGRPLEGGRRRFTSPLGWLYHT